MPEGKEKMPQQDKISPEKTILSDQDRESMGHALLKAGETKMAKLQFLAAHWTEENIQKILASADQKNPEKEPKKMEPEEKKELFRKMAEEFEEHAKNAEGKEWGKKYEQMARIYRREVEKMEKKQKE